MTLLASRRDRPSCFANDRNPAHGETSCAEACSRPPEYPARRFFHAHTNTYAARPDLRRSTARACQSPSICTSFAMERPVSSPLKPSSVRAAALPYWFCSVTIWSRYAFAPCGVSVPRSAAPAGADRHRAGQYGAEHCLSDFVHKDSPSFYPACAFLHCTAAACLRQLYPERDFSQLAKYFTI